MSFIKIYIEFTIPVASPCASRRPHRASVTRAVARIQAGLDDFVYLGHLDSVRDWGYAPEYVEGMWRMLQADEPEDLVLATGESATVRDFVAAAFDHAGLDWEKPARPCAPRPAAARAGAARRR
ncbi:GDP-mannose 4,6-dehydratase [Staphylococcus aureus]|uniref:GDP-mannose 4,6-dehydratase n=1 Tax=Staphylococcus aureus TaxID=1280 RepID=UPI001C12ADE3|nr:GDP-mannose 4,6-dehydratase [Staphylococcus aureus]